MFKQSVINCDLFQKFDWVMVSIYKICIEYIMILLWTFFEYVYSMKCDLEAVRFNYMFTTEELKHENL